jgi:hypothetical protein
MPLLISMENDLYYSGRVDLYILSGIWLVFCLSRHILKFFNASDLEIRGKNNKVMSCLNPEAVRSTTYISGVISEKVIFFQKTTDLLHLYPDVEYYKSVFYSFCISEAVETPCGDTL